MHADIGFPLTREYVSIAPASDLHEAVRSWLKRANPICLLHPHGFYVVLLSRNDTDEWRFHFWPKGPRTVVGMPAAIHTHDRHVESRVLQGQITNVLYEVVTAADGGRPLYEVSYLGDRYKSATSNCLKRTSTRVRLLPQHREVMRRGNRYHVERHAYHEVEVPEQCATATLVCMYGRSPGAVRVVGLEGYPNTISFKRVESSALAFVEELYP